MVRISSFGTSAEGFGTLPDGSDDALVGAATADVAVHGADDFRFGWIGLFPQKSDARHEHAGRAVAALHCAGIEECLLERMQLAVVFKAFDGFDFAAADSADGGDAGAGGNAIKQDGAGATLGLAATVFAAGEIQIVAQNAEETAFAIGIERDVLPVDMKFSDLGHRFWLIAGLMGQMK